MQDPDFDFSVYLGIKGIPIAGLIVAVVLLGIKCRCFYGVTVEIFTSTAKAKAQAGLS